MSSTRDFSANKEQSELLLKANSSKKTKNTSDLKRDQVKDKKQIKQQKKQYKNLYNGEENTKQKDEININHVPIYHNNIFIRKVIQMKKNQTVQMKDNFENYNDYTNTMFTLLANYCISDLELRVQRILEKKTKPSYVLIKQIYKTRYGKIYIHIEFCEPTIHMNTVQHQIGLLTNYDNNNSSYNFEYGVPWRRNKNLFSVVCYIETKQKNNNNIRYIKISAYLYPTELYLILLGQKSRKVHFYQLDKISSHFNEYMGLLKIKNSELYPFIVDPRQYVNQKCKGNSYFDSSPLLTVMASRFNENQLKAIREITWKHSGMYLIQGPPGTGKTETLLGLVAAHLYVFKKCQKNRNKILICAPSNSVVDSIAKKLVLGGVLGVYGKVWPRVLRMSPKDTQDELLQEINYDVVCAKELARIYFYKNKSAFGHNNFLNNRRKIKKYIGQRVLLEAEIIFTTLNSSGSGLLNVIKDMISLVIVDEAAQATETSAIIPLQTGCTKIVLIGDPKQLPATVLSQDSNKTNFNRSLFYRLQLSGVTPYFLNVQYRMDSFIREFPSNKFYDGKLLDGPNIYERRNNKDAPYIVHSFQNRSIIFVGVEYEEECFYNNSYSNAAEAEIVDYIVRKYLWKKDWSIGVITPYQYQKKKIDSLLCDPQIMVNTVDSFQGQEKDAIIVSTVRSNDKGSIGFLSDERRTNVMITRSKYLLIVVGNPQTLSKNETWNQYISFLKKNNRYHEIKSKDVQKQTVDMIMSNNTQRSDYLQEILQTSPSKEESKKEIEQERKSELYSL